MAESRLTQERFYRLPKQGVFSGVCAGIADSFDIHPNIVRAGLIIFLVSGVFPLAIAYLALIFILPKEYHNTSGPEPMERDQLTYPNRTIKAQPMKPRDIQYKLERLQGKLNKIESYIVSDRYQLDHQYKNLEQK